MPIPVTCRSCNRSFTAPDSASGKRTKCPNCGGVIDIPVADLPDDIFDAEEVPPQPFEDHEYEVEPPPERPVAADDRKPCPLCGEMIRRDAAKCRYCGEVFDPVLRAKEKKTSFYSEDDDPSALEWILCILFSGIGCIVAIVYITQGKPKGKKMLLASICAWGFWAIVRFLIIAANQP